MEFPTPEILLGSIATFPLPRVPLHSDGTPWTPLEIWDTLNEKYRTQVICQDLPTPGDTTIRISAMLYNSDDDYRHLAEAMKEILS
jgi:selenocysteine lyase/cysteine desulfurase